VNGITVPRAHISLNARPGPGTMAGMASLLSPDWHRELHELRLIRTGKPIPCDSQRSSSSRPAAAFGEPEPTLRQIMRFRGIDSILDRQRRYHASKRSARAGEVRG
jgi:hypothetical protein